MYFYLYLYLYLYLSVYLYLYLNLYLSSLYLYLEPAYLTAAAGSTAKDNILHFDKKIAFVSIVHDPELNNPTPRIPLFVGDEICRIVYSLCHKDFVCTMRYDHRRVSHTA